MLNSSRYRMRSITIFRVFSGLFRLSFRPSLHSKIGGLDPMHVQIKVIFIPEMFCIVYRQKGIVKQKVTLENAFVPRLDFLEKFCVAEKVV